MRRIALGVALGYLMIPGAWILNHLFIDPRNRVTRAFGIIMGACFVFLTWSMHQYETWPCPRCGLAWKGVGTRAWWGQLAWPLHTSVLIAVWNCLNDLAYRNVTIGCGQERRDLP
jgi:hypothetical protein